MAVANHLPRKMVLNYHTHFLWIGLIAVATLIFFPSWDKILTCGRPRRNWSIRFGRPNFLHVHHRHGCPNHQNCRRLRWDIPVRSVLSHRIWNSRRHLLKEMREKSGTITNDVTHIWPPVTNMGIISSGKVQPWWLGGRVLDNVQTQLMLYFGGSNPIKYGVLINGFTPLAIWILIKYPP